jgi:hypothetical protein
MGNEKCNEIYYRQYNAKPVEDTENEKIDYYFAPEDNIQKKIKALYEGKGSKINDSFGQLVVADKNSTARIIITHSQPSKECAYEREVEIAFTGNRFLPKELSDLFAAEGFNKR